MILLIDNYDSFSYNLYQQAASIEPDMRVVRNDALSIGEIAGLNPSHIILSPGPGYPKDAGICEEVVKKLGGNPHPRRLPRSSGHLRDVRRPHRARAAAHARQAEHGRNRHR